MANVLPKEKQLMAIRCLIEGNSIRGTERLTGIHRDTIMRVMLRFGANCQTFLNRRLVNLSMEHVELDEMWTFVKKKDKMRTEAEKQNDKIGSQYLYLALDQKSKLIASHLIGKRNEQNTHKFVSDLRNRMHVAPDRVTAARPQVSTDGWPSYYPAIRDAFNQTVRHGVVIKQYVNPEVGRYAPPDMRRAVKSNVNGIAVLATICTSHIERCNLTFRTFLKRFTRLALGFSKKLENLEAAVAMFVSYYNFVWRMRENGNSGKLRSTPAMQAGIVDRLWDINDLFDAVQKAERERKSDERYAKLAKRLRERN